MKKYKMIGGKSDMNHKNEYAQSGVDYSLMEPFKMAMIEAGKKTLAFPNKRGVYVVKEAMHAHGAVYEYRGKEKDIMWGKTKEDLGKKIGIEEWMYMKPIFSP